MASEEPRRADLKRFLLGVAAAGAGIAAGAVLVVRTIDWSIWLGPGTLYILAGLFAISMICWTVRVARRIGPTASPGTFASRTAFASAFALFAFQAAALILLAAGLAALAFDAAIRSALFEAIILTFVALFVTRLLCLGILNLALVIEEPMGKPTTPYWKHEGEP